MCGKLQAAEVSPKEAPGGRVEVRYGDQQLAAALEEPPALPDRLGWITHVLQDVAQPDYVEPRFGQAGARNVGRDGHVNPLAFQDRTVAGVDFGPVQVGEPQRFHGLQGRAVATTDV